MGRPGRPRAGQRARLRARRARRLRAGDHQQPGASPHADQDLRRDGRQRPGDEVTYTVTATNDGTGDWTATDPATLVDDLTGVLDDATYDGDATASVGATRRTPRRGCAGPARSAHGDSVTIEYTVTLTGGGDGHVDNVVWQPATRATPARRRTAPTDAAAVRRARVRPAQADDQEDVEPGPAAGRRPEDHLHGDGHQPGPRRLHGSAPGDVQRRPDRRARRRDLRRRLDHRDRGQRRASTAPRSTGAARSPPASPRRSPTR